VAQNITRFLQNLSQWHLHKLQSGKKSLSFGKWKRRQQVILQRIVDAIWHAGCPGARRLLPL